MGRGRVTTLTLGQSCYGSPVPRWDHLKQYGLTVEDYHALLSAQDGHCATCPTKGTARKRLSVDHAHRSGRVRGLLCGRCNTLIGYLHEDDVLLENLALYLREPPANDVFDQPRLHVDAPEWGDTQ